MVFLNGDDPFLVPYRGRLEQKTFFYGLSDDCDYRAEDIVNGDGQISFTFCADDLRLPVTLSPWGNTMCATPWWLLAWPIRWAWTCRQRRRSCQSSRTET